MGVSVTSPKYFLNFSISMFLLLAATKPTTNHIYLSPQHKPSSLTWTTPNNDPTNIHDFYFFHFLRLQQQPKAPQNFRHHRWTSDITADTSNDQLSWLNCLARNFLKIREILTFIYDFFALCVSKATLEFSLGFVHICIINFFHLFIVLHSTIVKVEKKSALIKRKKVQSLWFEISHISTIPIYKGDTPIWSGLFFSRFYP